MPNYPFGGNYPQVKSHWHKRVIPPVMPTKIENVMLIGGLIDLFEADFSLEESDKDVLSQRRFSTISKSMLL